MQFTSFADFLNMGGYGFYVWLSYGVSTLLIVYLLFASVSRHKALLQQIAQRQKREQKLRQAAEQQMEKKGLTHPKVEQATLEQIDHSINEQISENKEASS
jgi:heme exporter protein D